MIRLFYASLVIILLGACNSGGTTGPSYDLTGFATESIGGGAQLATYTNQSGKILTKGQVINGVRTGAWVAYHEDSYKVRTITNYINGKKNGIEFTLSDRGQVESITEYKNDILHGMVAKYSFGHPIEEMTYKDGVLDGPFSIYSNRKIQRSGGFKNGKQHGKLRYYDEAGNITLEYDYKNGEKVGGGIIEKPAEEVGS